jgi:hypothetical protein
METREDPVLAWTPATTVIGPPGFFAWRSAAPAESLGRLMGV